MSLPFATGSGVGVRRWPARFDTLRVKLFVGIAGANALLALATFLVFTWSFDQGFVEYLNRADESRLRPLVVRLADGYRKEGDWRWISGDRRRWMDLMREVFGAVRPVATMVQVSGFAHPDHLVEIELDAHLAPDGSRDRLGS